MITLWLISIHLLVPGRSTQMMCFKVPIVSVQNPIQVSKLSIAENAQSTELDARTRSRCKQRADGLPLLQLPAVHLHHPGPVPQPHPGELPPDNYHPLMQAGEAQHSGRGWCEISIAWSQAEKKGEPAPASSPNLASASRNRCVCFSCAQLYIILYLLVQNPNFLMVC